MVEEAAMDAIEAGAKGLVVPTEHIPVHKFEYFLNARIVGQQIKASAWELLCAMLVADAAFGVSGLIAAPIFYAYIKDELKAIGWL